MANEIFIVSESPLTDPELQTLSNYLSRAGVRLEDVAFGSLVSSPLKPRDWNSPSNSTLESIDQLAAQIAATSPNVILGLGAWPLWHLTGCSAAKGAGTGLTNYRGSILPCSMVGGRKVVCSFDLKYINSPRGFQWNPVFGVDVAKAVRESKTPKLTYPTYQSIINPTSDVMDELMHEFLQAEMLSIDIETIPGGQMTCIGITDSLSRGLCLTWEQPHLWDYARELMASPVRKVFQYGNYDVNFLHKFYDWRTANYWWDTYVASCHLMPEFPRGLDFLTSIYTPFPYYKEERKLHKNTGDMTTLWEYNIKDIIATLWIALEQMKEMEDLYG